MGYWHERPLLRKTAKAAGRVPSDSRVARTSSPCQGVTGIRRAQSEQRMMLRQHVALQNTF
jgi:hypothetical protein